MIFRNRRDAGRALVSPLSRRPLENAVILGLPRGGVPVAFEIAAGVGTPLDVFVVRKLGVPGFEELAMGAIAGDGVQILNGDVLDRLRIPLSVVEMVARREGIELERRLREYRGNRPPLLLSGRTAVLVDDGLATGATMRAAVAAARILGPSRVVVAVPVASPGAVEDLASLVDEMVYLEMPEPFESVGTWYEDFTQTTDAEVRDLLQTVRFSPPLVAARLS